MVFFIGTNHDCFQEYKYPDGSIVINPWRMPIKYKGNFKHIRVGDNSKAKEMI